MLMSTIKKKLPNSGSFKPGPDPRRHQLTRDERRKGYQMFLLGVQLKRYPSRLSASVRKRIRGYYQDKAAARRTRRGPFSQEIPA